MKRYLITGATGYIGSLLTEELLQRGEQVTVIIRDAERLKQDFKGKVGIIQNDICNAKIIDKVIEPYDYIIHCAAPTKSSYMMTNPVEVANAIVGGTRNMLEVANKCHVRRMVYLSSMEVYGKVNCSNGKKVLEYELGDVDLTDIRSCYPMSKRMAENYCNLYHSEYNVPVIIARLSQTFGRGVSPNDNRVFAQFSNSVREHKDIVLHTEGESVGNYCDIDDAISGILYLLEHGEFGQTYNIVNESNTMTIREMAELVSEKIAGGKIRVTFDIPKDNCFGYAVETGLRLSGAKMKSLGWEAKTSLVEMYQKMLLEWPQ